MPLRKLTDYALSPNHSVGKHKARLFQRLFGLERHHAADLRSKLLRVAVEEEAVFTGPLVGGDGYRIDFMLDFGGRSGWIRSGWIVPEDGSPTILVTVFPIRR